MADVRTERALHRSSSAIDRHRLPAHTAFVPPHTVDSGLASFASKNFKDGAWVSPAEGRWLVVENKGDQHVEAGTVVVCLEGGRVVTYFYVERVVEPTA